MALYDASGNKIAETEEKYGDDVQPTAGKVETFTFTNPPHVDENTTYYIAIIYGAPDSFDSIGVNYIDSGGVSTNQPYQDYTYGTMPSTVTLVNRTNQYCVWATVSPDTYEHTVEPVTFGVTIEEAILSKRTPTILEGLSANVTLNPLTYVTKFLHNVGDQALTVAFRAIGFLKTTVPWTVDGTIKEKRYVYKVYDAEGNFIKTWSKEHIKNSPSFSMAINSGAGELTINLSLFESNYGENSDVKYGNRVKVYCFDRDTDVDGVVVYSGYITKYTPFIRGNEEGVTVTLLSDAWYCGRMMLLDGIATTVQYLSQDPSDIMRDLLDKFTARDGMLSYTYSSIDDTDTTVSYTFNTNTFLEAMRKVLELSPLGWYFRIDPSDKDRYLSFDGTNDNVEGHVVQLRNDLDVTIEFEPDVVNTQKILLQRDGAVRSDLIEIQNDGKILFSIKTAGTPGYMDLITSDGVAVIGERATYRFTYNALGGATIYKNGAVVTTAAYAGDYDTANQANNWRIGSLNNSSRFFDGKLYRLVFRTDGVTRFSYDGSKTSDNKLMDVSENDRHGVISGATFGFADDFGIVQMHEKNDAADHQLVLGHHISEYMPEKRIENMVNTIYFVGDGIYKKYTNTSSVSEFGEFSTKYIDQRVSVETTADIIAGRILDSQSSPEVRVVIKVLDNNGQMDGKGYDIESLKVGQTVKIKNATSKSDNAWDDVTWDVDSWDYEITNAPGIALQIMSIEYSPESAVLELSNRLPDVAKRIEDINRNFVDSVTVDNPSTPDV